MYQTPPIDAPGRQRLRGWLQILFLVGNLADLGSASPTALSTPVRGGSRVQQQGREVHVLRPHLEENVDLQSSSTRG